jgi:hypothetical protein
VGGEPDESVGADCSVAAPFFFAAAAAGTPDTTPAASRFSPELLSLGMS